MDWKVISIYAAFAFMAVIISTSSANAIEIVRVGITQSEIVIPDSPLKVVNFAAEELQYHIQKSTGVAVPIINESDSSGSRNHVYLGNCKRTLRSGIDIAKLGPNECIIKLYDHNLFIAGNDSEGEPIGPLQANWTKVGTLFGVYEFLEKQLGVRWLWPGVGGEVIPKHKQLSVNAWDQHYIPPLKHSRFRDGGFLGSDGWSSVEISQRYYRDQSIWMRRQRFAMGVKMDIHHSFVYGDYWNRFSTSHPEYFNLLPDGTRRSDSLHYGGTPDLVGMSVAEPGLWKQIVDDWKVMGGPQNGSYIDASENDTPGKCVCEKCLTWDVNETTTKETTSERLKKAKDAFLAKDPLWYVALGSVSDRYAKYYLAVEEEARKVNPDAVVMGFAYENYSKPPVSTKLNDHILIGLVPQFMFPWSRESRQAFKKQWLGWSETGAKLMLRPNYTLSCNNFPVFYAKKLGEDLAFCAKHGMIATDFDSLTGQWATQGPNLYVLARMNSQPTKPVNDILDEYYSGFGPAKAAVRKYFLHWEKVDEAITEAFYNKAAKEYGGNWQVFYCMADSIFTPTVMSKGWELLDKAEKAAKGDRVAEARVDFLKKGLRNVDLTLATQKANREYRKTGVEEPFHQAMKELYAYRKSIESDYIGNFNMLSRWEDITWDRSVLKQ